jgi:hypothetical protein
MDSPMIVGVWLGRVSVMKDLHYAAAVHFERLHRCLGIPAAVFSAIVGTTIFATLQGSTSLSLKVATGVLSIASAVLIGLQSFLRYGERAEKHRAASGQYGLLKFELERIGAFPPNNPKALREELKAFGVRWAEIRQASPTIPPRLVKFADALEPPDLPEVTDVQPGRSWGEASPSVGLFRRFPDDDL